MDYEQVYYVTGDNSGRNATPVVIDHRTGARLPTRTTNVISAAPAAVPAAASWGPSMAPYQYGQPGFYGPAVMPNGWTGYPVQPPYIMPPTVAPGSNLATILGGFGDVGSLANIIAQVFAALLPLPAAPAPQDNNDSDSATNAAVNSSNLIRYQNALALFARRDQQILTLGSVLKELFKRPGMVTG
jgi:hypothetical protein